MDKKLKNLWITRDRRSHRHCRQKATMRLVTGSNKALG